MAHLLLLQSFAPAVASIRDALAEAAAPDWTYPVDLFTVYNPGLGHVLWSWDRTGRRGGRRKCCRVRVLFFSCLLRIRDRCGVNTCEARRGTVDTYRC